MKIKIQLAPGGRMPVKADNGDWYDLSSAEDVEFGFATGRIRKISLGIAMQIPEGYCAMIVPRSSLLIKKGFLMQTGIIDNSFCGPNDVWHAIGVGFDNNRICAGERVAQFRLLKNYEGIEFEEAHLTGKDRGGFGFNPRTHMEYDGGLDFQPHASDCFNPRTHMKYDFKEVLKTSPTGSFQKIMIPYTNSVVK